MCVIMVWTSIKCNVILVSVKWKKGKLANTLSLCGQSNEINRVHYDYHDWTKIDFMRDTMGGGDSDPSITALCGLIQQYLPRENTLKSTMLFTLRL